MNERVMFSTDFFHLYETNIRDEPMQTK